jgi:hypothetical protein
MAKLAVPSSQLNEMRLALAEVDMLATAAETPDKKRIAALRALKAIYDFLKSIGLSSRVLNNLSMSLQDIDRGHSPTLFTPCIHNRPRDEAKYFILKAVSAAAMQLLMDSGKKKSEAAAIVATRLDSAGFQMPGRDPKPVSARGVARWRDIVAGHSNAEGADIYEFTLEQARADCTAPAQQAERVMRGLPRLVKNLD